TAESLHRRLIDVGEFTTTVGQRWSQSVQRRWRVDAAAAGMVEADPHRLEEAIDALVENALRFTTTEDTIRISCRADGPWARIEVADSGPGLPPGGRARALRGFLTPAPAGQRAGHGPRAGPGPGGGHGARGPQLAGGRPRRWRARGAPAAPGLPDAPGSTGRRDAGRRRGPVARR